MCLHFSLWRYRTHFTRKEGPNPPPSKYCHRRSSIPCCITIPVPSLTALACAEDVEGVGASNLTRTVHHIIVCYRSQPRLLRENIVHQTAEFTALFDQNPLIGQQLGIVFFEDASLVNTRTHTFLHPAPSGALVSRRPEPSKLTLWVIISRRPQGPPRHILIPSRLKQRVSHSKSRAGDNQQTIWSNINGEVCSYRTQKWCVNVGESNVVCERRGTKCGV